MQPAVFFAHGSPLSALGGDEHAAALRAFGERTRPRAIVIVSAHWQLPDLRVTAWQGAPLVYDFGGFPEELYRIQYAAPGDPELAARIAAATGSHLETRRGLDHGAWVPLRLAWPDATIPVVQVSLPDASPRQIYALGRALQPLRQEDILIAGSGGIVHNLRRVRFADKEAAVEPWAAEFDSWVAARIAGENIEELFDYRSLAPHVAAAVPSSEHFDPLFVTLGAALPGEHVRNIFEGFQYGNLSMRSFALSAQSRAVV